MKKIVLLWMLAIVLTVSAWGLRNPAAVYCTQMGYEYAINQTPDGDVGVCRFSDGTDCVGWDFLQGSCGLQHSYCIQKGYEQRPGSGTECGVSDPTAVCLLCIMKNGSAVEVGEVMDLYSKLNEGVCGDSLCTIGENHESCPQDCQATPTTSEEVTTMPPEETTTWILTTTIPPETTTQPPESTTLPEETTLPLEASTTTISESLCGNSVCDPVESFDSCPKDCSKPTGPVDYLPYIVIIVVLLVIIFIVKKKLDEKKIAKEKAEFEKWKQEKGGSAI